MSAINLNCQLCNGAISVFYINEEEAVAMCIKPECKYPFRTGDDLKIIPKSEAEALIKNREVKRSELYKISATGKARKSSKKKPNSESTGDAVTEEYDAANFTDFMDNFDIDTFLAQPSSEGDDIKIEDVMKEILMGDNQIDER